MIPDVLNEQFQIPIEKLMVASTPKTGNTWVKLILSRVYEIPVLIAPNGFELDDWINLGESWIVHQHIPPSTDSIKWFNQNNIPIVTTIRHPGDVLVSLYHYTKWKKTNGHLDALAKDKEKMGEHTLQFVKSHRFAKFLQLSIKWLKHGSYVMRYEDLLHDPISVISNFAQKVEPVDIKKIQSAVASCELSVLKKTNDKRHFRAGIKGQWQNEIPEEALNYMKTDKLYQKIFNYLGYSLDINPNDSNCDYFDYSTINPFHNVEHFSNGVKISGIITQYYFSSLEFQEKWQRPFVVEQDNSFFNWLNEAAEGNQSSWEKFPLINNIADYIYKIRPDVQKVFPDYLGKDRKRYFKWFNLHGQQEYGLDGIFCEEFKA